MINIIKTTTEYIKTKTKLKPEVGIILGTGLGGLVNEIDIVDSIDYNEIPNFPISTVEGHKGRLVFGILGGKNIVAMQGRFHYYEGYSMDEVTFPIKIMNNIGIKYLFVSNASGGINPKFKTGDVMIIEDHINNFNSNPLMGSSFDINNNHTDSNIYNKELIEKAINIANNNNIEVKKGVYIGSTGPTLETQAEYRYFKVIGADATGMSTVPEIIAAHQMNIKCFAISIITNIGIQDNVKHITTHEDVQKVAGTAEQKMTFIMKNLINTL